MSTPDPLGELDSFWLPPRASFLDSGRPSLDGWGSLGNAVSDGRSSSTAGLFHFPSFDSHANAPRQHGQEAPGGRAAPAAQSPAYFDSKLAFDTLSKLESQPHWFHLQRLCNELFRCVCGNYGQVLSRDAHYEMYVRATGIGVQRCVTRAWVSF